MITNYFNAIICLLIAVRLFTFSRKDSTYKLTYGLLAWAMICSSSAVFIFSCFGFIERAHIAQTILNCLLFVCVIKAQGNIAKIGKPLKSAARLKTNA